MKYRLPPRTAFSKVVNLLSLIPALLFADDSLYDVPEPIITEGEPGVVSLIQPNSFEGWVVPTLSDLWTIEDGVIAGDTGATGPDEPEFIFTEDSYTDYIFTAELKVGASETGKSKAPNSGLFHRATPFLYNGQYTAPGGYEYDFMSDLDNSNNGSIGNWYARNDLRIPPHTSLHGIMNVDDWNRITIRMIGNTMEYWMNGVKIQHYIEVEMPTYALSGPIALQLHNNRKMRIEMRNARILPIVEYHGFGVNSGSEVDLDEYYLADFGANKGNMISRNRSIDVSLPGVDAAPEALYQTARISRKFTYTFGDLKTDTAYNVLLHFVEYKNYVIGERQFNVEINDTPVLVNYDILAETGGQRFKAVTEAFEFTTDSTGSVKIEFLKGAADKPQVSGIEIFEVVE
ncbi:MAG: family 16 glycoside hydrolase [Opitutales bacterium]